MYVLACGAEIDDGITDHLAETVISGLAAAIRLKERDAARAQGFVCGEHCARTRAPPQRDHVRVLDEQQRIGLRACAHGAYRLFLNFVSCAVLHQTETANL